MEGAREIVSGSSGAQPTTDPPKASETASEEPVQPGRPATRWVRIRCGARLYGMPLERVREILTPQPLTRLPGCGATVAGLVGVRGRVVTALDLGWILGPGASVSLPDHRLLLVDIEGRTVGLVVDEARAVVDGVLHPPVPEPERLAGLDAEGADVLGMVDSGNERFPALDLDAVIGRHFA